MKQANMRHNDHLKHDIIDSLMADSRLDASGVNVDVIDGAVYLTGIIPSLAQKRIAARVVGRMKGVLAIDDELKVVPVTSRSDADIRKSIIAALVRDVIIDETKIDVQVINGVARLTGKVDNFTAKRAVDEIAWSTHGVVDVMDYITIEPHSPRTDDEIARDVKLQLERNIRIRPKQVQVNVQDGVVRLEGCVSTMAQRWIAEELSRWVPGVIDVEDNLDVTD